MPAPAIQVQHFAEKYFGTWQPTSNEAWPDEPDAAKPRGASRRLEQPGRAGPVLMQAFYRGTVNSQDAIRLEVIAYALCPSISVVEPPLLNYSGVLMPVMWALQGCAGRREDSQA